MSESHHPESVHNPNIGWDGSDRSRDLPDSIRDLKPTQYELDERRNKLVNAENAIREAKRVYDANRAAGHPVPEDGDKWMVALDSKVARRSRSGLQFERDQRLPVEVLDLPEDEIKARQANGERVVSLMGAEYILEDSALYVIQGADDDRKVAELEAAHAKIAELEEELRLSRSEQAQLDAKKRQARQSAPESPTGAPTRLQAARAVEGETPSAEASASPAATPAAKQDPDRTPPATPAAQRKADR